MNRNALLWITMMLATTHPFMLLIVFANFYQEAVACLGHPPRFMVDDPKIICSLNPAYQGASNLLLMMLYLAPVCVLALVCLCLKVFRKKPVMVAFSLLIHVFGWFYLCAVAKANSGVIDWFID
ncbi:MAG: hypothetical protein H7Y38_04420 [Armatimonadetes bacterium]|nr:hypothetical protein [Armatimonadota bacterium]